jgi:hypothetical protein
MKLTQVLQPGKERGGGVKVVVAWQRAEAVALLIAAVPAVKSGAFHSTKPRDFGRGHKRKDRTERISRIMEKTD